MKRINIMVNEPLHERLKAVSRAKGISVSELFRRAAEAMYGSEQAVPEKKKPKPRKPKK